MQSSASADVLLVDVSVGLQQHLGTLEAVSQHAVHERSSTELVATVQISNVRWIKIITYTYADMAAK